MKAARSDKVSSEIIKDLDEEFNPIISNVIFNSVKILIAWLRSKIIALCKSTEPKLQYLTSHLLKLFLEIKPRRLQNLR